jgi:hypothetical protein
VNDVISEGAGNESSVAFPRRADLGVEKSGEVLSLERGRRASRRQRGVRKPGPLHDGLRPHEIVPVVVVDRERPQVLVAAEPLHRPVAQIELPQGSR